jgi:outer membrane protein assembly factor BamB
MAAWFRRLRVFGVSVALLALFAGRVRAQDWPQWRGPDRDGTAAGFQAPTKWPRSLVQAWKVPVGLGHATPLVSEGRVYAFARDEKDQEAVVCLELDTGRELWRQSYAAPYEVDPAAEEHGPGPKSTPLLFEGRLYTLGISGILACWDAASGEQVWRDLTAFEFPQSSPQFGTATSPLVIQGSGGAADVAVDVGGREGGVLAAFDAPSGRIRWDWKHDDGPGYASPLLVTLNRTPQIVMQTRDACVGLSPGRGELLWRLPFTTQYEQNSVTPLAWRDLLIFGGYRRPTIAVRALKIADKWTAEEVWRNEDAPMYMSTPVIFGDRLYGMSQRDSGMLFTLDPAEGKLLWSGQGRLGDNAALVVTDDVLAVLTTDASLLIEQPDGNKLREIARYRVAEGPTWAHPVLTGDSILVKDVGSVYCWRIMDQR